MRQLSRYSLELTKEKSVRISTLGRVLPRYLRLDNGRGFSWMELEEVDLRYRVRTSNRRYYRTKREGTPREAWMGKIAAQLPNTVRVFVGVSLNLKSLLK